MKNDKLTDNDTAFAESKFEKMLGHIEEKLGKIQERVKEEFDRWEFK